jgi:cell wall-associated NlpC family hydrolase
MWAWGQAGVSLPHQARQQYAMLPHVSQADIQPGDLLFFYNPIHHVALYIGNGTMVEAPATGLTVRTRAVSWGTVVGIGRP